MKGFIVSFAISAALMLGLVYTVVINPSLFTNLFGIGNSPPTIPEGITTTDDEINSENTEGNRSYASHIEKGTALLEEGHYGLAAAEYQLAIALDPQKAEGYALLGKATYENGAYLEAKAALEKASTLNPGDVDVEVLLGETLIALEQFDTAARHFELLQNTDPRIGYYQGILKAYEGAYAEAESLFQQVINSGDSSKLSEKANTYLDSIAEFNLTSDAPTNYGKTLVARSLAETDQPALAISLLYEVLTEDSDYRDAWIILGYVYLSQEKYADAEEALLKAVTLDPTKAETRYFLGLSYLGQGEFQSAIPQLELALQSGFEPRVQLYQKLGDAAVGIKDYAKAAEAYENVLLLNSSDVTLYIRPIWLYLDHLKNIEAARELAERAVAEHPNAAMSYNLLGWVQTEAGEWETAKESLNYALILDPDLAAAYLNWGRWYEVQGLIQEAKTSYKHAYTLDAGGSIGNLAGERYNQLLQQESTTNTSTEATNTNKLSTSN